MGILAFIQRKHEWSLPLGKPAEKRPEPAVRMCEFGHPVYAGNNLCSYGHHPAKTKHH
ncbi:MAG TPA: hypothetical protein VMY76_11040 [Gemmatimonadales bacterium]|nr:hypothetical protein [Gemmatimonadales bacterium]